MARRIGGRIKISGVLVAEGPLSVGGMGGDVDVDLALARDGRGRLYVPGTSLAGPLRDWIERNISDVRFSKELFGFQDEDEGRASALFIEDAVIEGASDDDVEVRDGVGIDRKRGAAAQGVKYNRAVLPRGTMVPLLMTVELPEQDTQRGWVRKAVGLLLRALEAGEVGLGAARTRGLGRMKLEGKTCDIREENWIRGILEVLREGGKKIDIADLLGSSADLAEKSPAGLDVEIRWKADGPVMVKAERDGIAVDLLPLVSGKGSSEMALVIPGSSIKGALRSQAERIVRTVLGHDAGEGFLEQVQVPLVEHLFGSSKRKKKDGRGEDEPVPKPPGRGALFVDDCYGSKGFSRDSWKSVETAVDEGALRQALDQAGLRDTQHAFHVAVDRWTGGAADGFLYSGLEPLNHPWEPIRMRIDLDFLPPGLRVPATALILLLLRDLAEKRIPIGFGSNRGMGSVKVESVAVRGRGLEAEIECLGSVDLGAGDLKAIGIGNLKKIEMAWTSWIDRQTRAEVTA